MNKHKKIAKENLGFKLRVKIILNYIQNNFQIYCVMH